MNPALQCTSMYTTVQQRMRVTATLCFCNMADQEGREPSQDQDDGNAEAKVTDEKAVRNELPEESKIHSATANTGSSKKSAKKRKKAKKAEGATAGAVAATSNADQGPSQQSDLSSASVNMKTLRQIQRAMEQLMVGDKPARTKTEAKQRKYHFWDTQPVPKIGREIGPILHLPYDKTSNCPPPRINPYHRGWVEILL